MWQKVQEYIDTAAESGRNTCQIPKWDINKEDITFLQECGVKTTHDTTGYVHLEWGR